MKDGGDRGENKRYVCEVCGKRFKDYDDLFRHKIKHLYLEGEGDE